MSHLSMKLFVHMFMLMFCSCYYSHFEHASETGGVRRFDPFHPNRFRVSIQGSIQGFYVFCQKLLIVYIEIIFKLLLLRTRISIFFKGICKFLTKSFMKTKV